MKTYRWICFLCALLLFSAFVDAQRISLKGYSISQIRSEAEKNDAGCQFMLGYYYEVGQRLDKNISLAKYWYDRAIKNGFEDAKIRLAAIYDDEKNYSNSYPLWLSYADNSSNEYKNKTGINNTYNLALFKVAVCKMEGRGTSIDKQGAIKYAEKARHNGDTSVLNILYTCYDAVGNVNKSFIIAKELYEKRGVPLFLAKHYLYGEGCVQDLEKVYSMLTEMANGKLTYSYSDGVTVKFGKTVQYACWSYIGIANYFDKNKKNHYEEAVRWLTKVAESDEALNETRGESMCVLQRCYRFGRGVNRNISKANELEREAKKLISEEDYNKVSSKFSASY